MNSLPKSAETVPIDTEVAKDPLELFPWLPCVVTLEVAVSGVTIGDFLKMKTGTVVTTCCGQDSDMPLRVNGELIGWTEFEVIDNQLAVRITELA